MNPHDEDRHPEAPFDPDARRREIERMEREFRERAERSGGGPVLTGDVNERVQGEMQEFFAESEAHLEQVVPHLDDAPGQGLSETTGEIREKLEQFFTQVNETAPASAAAANDLHQRQQRWAGMESAPEPEPERRRPFSPSKQAGGDKMDLKTALERLKRHGVVKDGGVGAARPAAPAEPARPPARAAAPARAPDLAVGPTMSELSLTHEVRLPPLSGGANRSPAPPMGAPRSAPPPPTGFAGRQTARQPVPAPRAPQPQPRRAEEFAARPPRIPQPEPDSAPVLQPIPTGEIRRPRRAAPVVPPPVTRRAPPVIPVPEPRRPAPDMYESQVGNDPRAGEFDEIFSEVEDLVIATLRESTQALSIPDARPGGEPLPVLPAPPERPPAAPQRPQPVPARKDAPPLSQVLPPPVDDENDEVDVEEEAPVGPHDWGVKTSAGPRGAWLLGTDVVPPTQTLDPAATKLPPPTAAPRLSPNTPPRTPESGPAAPEPEPEPSPPSGPPAGDGGGVGARQIIMKKLKQQAQEFEPVLQALREKNILSEEDVRRDDESGPGEDSDEVSIDSFSDRPRGEDMNLTPMQMVEEIRRLRRVQEALLRKGVLCDADISQPIVDD